MKLRESPFPSSILISHSPSLIRVSCWIPCRCVVKGRQTQGFCNCVGVLCQGTLFPKGNVNPCLCVYEIQKSKKAWKNKTKQDSPPAWPQETYRPLRSKHSLSCPGEGGYRYPAWGRGVPLSWAGSIPILPGVGVGRGTSLGRTSDRIGVPPPGQDLGQEFGRGQWQDHGMPPPQKGPRTRDQGGDLGSETMGYPLL